MISQRQYNQQQLNLDNSIVTGVERKDMPKQKLSQRSDGRYSCRYGQKYFYGKTTAEAIKKRDQYIRQLQQQATDREPSKPVKRIKRDSFLDYGLQWLQIYRTQCNVKQQNQYRTMIQYAAQTFRKKYIQDITASEVQRLYNTLDGKSQSHISKFKTTIKSIFEVAMNDGLIDRNPAAMAMAPKGTHGGHRNLQQWQKALVQNTYEGHDFGICAMVMMFAGLRRGEVIYLDVDRDVDFQNRVIHVNGAVSYTEGNQPTISDGKTQAAIRSVPLNDILYEALKGRHGLLCTKEDGGTLSQTALEQKIDSYNVYLSAKLNGCPKRWYGKKKQHRGKVLPPWRDVHLRCHDFRVTFCTMCYEAGVPVKTLQSWMGHEDSTMIMQIYAKLTAQRQNADALRINAYLNQTQSFAKIS